MVYKISVPLVGGGTRKKEIIDANNNLNVDEIRAGTLSQAASHGYAAGGRNSFFKNDIQKYSFFSDGNSTDVGDLNSQKWASDGQSSASSGYASGGRLGPFGVPPGAYVNTIDKFPFSSNANATDVGDLLTVKYQGTGQSSTNDGYSSGGSVPYYVNPPSVSNVIQKFPFSTDTNASDVGDLTSASRSNSGQSSSVSGYNSGGYVPFAGVNTIEKFPFSTDANATDVSDLTVARYDLAGQSSRIRGYSSGGYSSSHETTIDKFPFAADANATDVGDLTQARLGPSGTSSSLSGYNAGGQDPSFYVRTIDKFPFSSDTNATDVGDLLDTVSGASGTQG